MSRLTKCLFTGTLLSALLLSGCGNKAQEETIPVASPESTEADAGQSFTGKISSINGNEITLYKAQSGGIQEPGEVEPDSAGENAAAGSDAPAASDSAAGSKFSTSSPAPQFTDEMIVITVDDNTEYVSLTGTAETESSAEAASGELTLTGLQAGDIITVTLTGGTLTAARIELQNGPVTGGGNLTAAPDASASPLPLPSPGSDGKPQETPGAMPDGKAGERPAGGQDGGPAGGAPGGDAPAGAGNGAAGGAAPGSAGGAPSGAPDKQGAAASAKPAATPAAGAKPAAGDNAGNGGIAPGAAMSFGKIKSISDSKITLYPAEVPSAAPQEGTAPAGSPQGQEPADRPSVEPGAGGQGGGEGGRPQGAGGGQMTFSEATTVITVASDTKLISITFADGKRTEAVIDLSTLKADDIIQYTLKSGTTQAESISLSSGGPGGK